MQNPVAITFDCLPLRTIARFDIPIDASPAFRELCERIGKAIRIHGTHNSYYLYRASCKFHLTNHESIGQMEFSFEGTVHTDDTDQFTSRCDLQVELVRETCDWLTQPIVNWFKETVIKAVTVEFDRYIRAGDLQKTVERVKAMQAKIDKEGGFLGMSI